MKYYKNSKWTAVYKKNGWRHYEVKNVFKKKKELELFAICDNKVNLIVKFNEISNEKEWIPGWVEVI